MKMSKIVVGIMLGYGWYVFLFFRGTSYLVAMSNHELVFGLAPLMLTIIQALMMVFGPACLIWLLALGDWFLSSLFHKQRCIGLIFFGFMMSFLSARAGIGAFFYGIPGGLLGKKLWMYVGFLPESIRMVCCWMIMTISGWLILGPVMMTLVHRISGMLQPLWLIIGQRYLSYYDWYIHTTMPKKSTVHAQQPETPYTAKQCSLPLHWFEPYRLVAQVPSTLSSEYEQKERLRSKVLEQALSQFGIEGAVTSCVVGPVVTMYRYLPSASVRVNDIVARVDDIARVMQAASIRVIAPIPGTPFVGFEVAGSTRSSVLFEECIGSVEYQNHTGLLPVLLGKESSGQVCVVDLSTLPHLLLAGSTGSGKSVTLHSLILSLIARKAPESVRLVLIDPKQLEFVAYQEIPHLLVPIVTRADEACKTLAGLVKLMEGRYTRFARVGVRSIHEYHEYCQQQLVAQQVVTQEISEQTPSEQTVFEQTAFEEPMPFIVVVIDEFADLMLVRSNDIEYLVVRLAQMARAAGIHLIIATQRPSVDVLTGTIKVNIPARLACRVVSKIDSRTVLDRMGAQMLLGAGDMLFLNEIGSLMRVHGAYSSSGIMKTIINACKEYGKPDYVSLVEKSEAFEELDDELLPDIISFVKTRSDVSISLIQRQFRIGFNRSAHILEILEKQGLVTSSVGSKMRRVVVDV
jgi:DNA segregation ATPase FtsK/SpoIIIE-like protein